MKIHRENQDTRNTDSGNAALLRWAFGARGLILSVVGICVALAVYGATLLPRTFLPPFNEGTLVVSLQYNPGISLAESHRLGLIAEQLALKVPEVKSIGRRTGRAELDEHAEGVHSSEVDIDLHRSDRPKEAIYADIRTALSVLPVSVNIGQPIGHRLDHMLSGVRAQIALKVYGEDLDAIRSLAETLRERLASVLGLVDLQVERQVRIPQLRIDVDHEKAALYGLTPASVTQALETLSNGRTVSQIVEGNRRYDVVLRLSDQDRSTNGLEDLLIATPSGHVPLRMIASVSETDGPNQIQRENGQRRIAVYGNGDGQRDMTAIIADIRGVVAQTPLPQGYVTRMEGTFQAQEEATLRIGLLSLVSLALIFVVLFTRYQSAVLALIIMGNIPLALIGSVVALHLADQPLSGGVDGRLHHARRHLCPQRHPQGLALHQPRPPRRRELRARPRHPRKPGTADAGADDGAVGGTRAGPAALRRRPARPRDPPSGRRHDLRRPDLGDHHRHGADADPLPRLRPQAARAHRVWPRVGRRGTDTCRDLLREKENQHAQIDRRPGHRRLRVDRRSP